MRTIITEGTSDGVSIPIDQPIWEKPVNTGYRSRQDKRANRHQRSARTAAAPHVWGERNSRDPRSVRRPPGIRVSRRS